MSEGVAKTQRKKGAESGGAFWEGPGAAKLKGGTERCLPISS